MTILHPVMGEVADEIDRQKALKEAGKFQSTAADVMKRGDIGTHVLISTEEFLELTEHYLKYVRAVNDHKPLAEIREELKQCAAVFVNGLIGLDERGQ